MPYHMHHDWREIFVAELYRLGRVEMAASAAGVCRGWTRQVRNREPEFDRRCKEAIAAFKLALIQARRDAIELPSPEPDPSPDFVAGVERRKAEIRAENMARKRAGWGGGGPRDPSIRLIRMPPRGGRGGSPVIWQSHGDG